MYKIILEKKPYHQYFKVEDDGTREKVLSVSKINGVEDKSKYLVPWAARVTAEYLINLIPDIKAGKLILHPDDIKDLFRKAKAEAGRQRDEAGDIGTKTHEAVEEYLKTGKKPKGLAPEIQKPFDGFLIFAKAMKLGKVIASEKIVYSESYEYAGTLDIVAELNGKRHLIDVKTSAGFYKEMPRQLAAYANAWDEKYPNKPIEGLGIIRLDKETGLPEFKDYTSKRDVSFRKFLCLLDFLELDK